MRRVRDLNPRWGISPHTISSRANYTTASPCQTRAGVVLGGKG